MIFEPLPLELACGQLRKTVKESREKTILQTAKIHTAKGQTKRGDGCRPLLISGILGYRFFTTP